MNYKILLLLGATLMVGACFIPKAHAVDIISYQEASKANHSVHELEKRVEKLEQTLEKVRQLAAKHGIDI